MKITPWFFKNLDFCKNHTLIFQKSYRDFLAQCVNCFQKIWHMFAENVDYFFWLSPSRTKFFQKIWQIFQKFWHMFSENVDYFVLALPQQNCFFSEIFAFFQKIWRIFQKFWIIYFQHATHHCNKWSCKQWTISSFDCWGCTCQPSSPLKWNNIGFDRLTIESHIGGVRGRWWVHKLKMKSGPTRPPLEHENQQDSFDLFASNHSCK